MNEDAAIRLVTEIGEAIRGRLSDIAAGYISHIRNLANEAWASRVKALLIALRSSPARFPLELIYSLDADAADPSQAVRHDVTKRMAQGSGDRVKADKDYEETVKKPWLSHRTAQAKIANKVDLDLDLTMAEEFIVKALNALGYLLRAPVLGSAIEPQLITDANWPSLAGQYTATLKRKQAAETFKRVVIDPWIKCLGDDSRDSIVGAIKVASQVAGGQVKAITDPKSENNSTRHPAGTQAMNMDSLNSLVVQHARSCLLYGALDEVCKKWTTEMSVILAKEFTLQEGDMGLNPESSIVDIHKDRTTGSENSDEDIDV